MFVGNHLVPVDSGLASIGDHLVPVDSGLASIGGHLVSVDSGLASIGDHLVAVDSGLASIGNHLVPVDSGLASVGNHLVSVDSGLVSIGGHLVPVALSVYLAKTEPLNLSYGKTSRFRQKDAGLPQKVALFPVLGHALTFPELPETLVHPCPKVSGASGNIGTPLP